MHNSKKLKKNKFENIKKVETVYKLINKYLNLKQFVYNILMLYLRQKYFNNMYFVIMKLQRII